MQFGIVFRTFHMVFTLTGLAIRPVDDAFHEIIIGSNARGLSWFKATQDGKNRGMPCLLYPLGNTLLFSIRSSESGNEAWMPGPVHFQV